MSIKQQVIEYITGMLGRAPWPDQIHHAVRLVNQLQEPPTLRPGSEPSLAAAILWLKNKQTGAVFWIRAAYFERFTLRLSEKISDEFGDYNREDDEYYPPEGWHEYSMLDEDAHMRICEHEYEILGWLPVQPPQSTEQGHD